MEPRLEPIEVAQRRELTPHLDEGRLDRVLGEVGVAERADQDRYRAPELLPECLGDRVDRAYPWS